MLGLYLHRESVIHRLSAGVKLGGLLLVTVAVLALPGAWGALAAGLIGTAVLVAAKLPTGRVLAELRAPVIMLTLLFGFQALLTGGGWEETAVAVARFAALILLAPVGVNPAKMALMLALTIRFIPLLGEQVREVRMAQRARGVERNIAALFVPLLVKILTMADDLTAALEARGYDPADTGTKDTGAKNPGTKNSTQR